MPEVRLVGVAKVSQMSNNRSGKPTDPNSYLGGWGSGGDRCTEDCSEIVLATYKNPPPSIAQAEDDMYKIVEAENNGSDVSSPMGGQTMVDWIHNHDSRLSLSDVRWPGFQIFVDAIDRGHLVIAGFNDYNKLRKYDNTSPYSWQDPNGLGHVLVVAGYDPDRQFLLVHDPLLGTTYQPTWYTFKSFQAAQCADALEVNGPALAKSISSPQGVSMSQLSDFFTSNPDGTMTCKSNGIVLWGEILNEYVSSPAPLADWGLPLSGEIPVASHPGVVYREFERGDMVYDPNRVYDSPVGATNKCYRGHVDRGQAQIDALIAQLKSAQPSPLDPKIRQALQDASSIFSSAGAIASELADALKLLP